MYTCLTLLPFIPYSTWLLPLFIPFPPSISTHVHTHTHPHAQTHIRTLHKCMYIHTHAHTTKGKIPMGYRFTAKNTSETTHEIPIEGFELAERDYRQVLRELESFLSPEGAQLPPVFAKVHPQQSCDIRYVWNKCQLCRGSCSPLFMVKLKLFVYNGQSPR